MSKHTPGPWRHARLGADREDWPTYIGGTNIVGPNDQRLCAFVNQGVNLGLTEALANARLMAAAPDLLAACEKAYDYLTGDSFITVADEEEAKTVALGLLIQAVAKARGE